MAIRYSRKDNLGHTNYYDEHNRKVGYSRKDSGLSGTESYYDAHGKRIGYSKDSSGGKIFYNNSGKYSGSSRKGNFGYTGYYDSHSKKVGESRKNLFGETFSSSRKK